MQKVFRRTILAEKQVARRATKRTQKKLRDKWSNQRDQNNYHRKDEIKTIKDARLARREDYELGPLAPRRDVGTNKDTYGTVSLTRMHGRPLHGKERSDILDFWGGKFLNIQVGDRVVILEGRDKGKIGKIKDINTKSADCTIEGLNMMDIHLPAYALSAEDPDQRPLRSIEQPISLKSVRLVTPLKDAETGVVRDVIVKEVTRSNIWFNKRGGCTWTRKIPGLNIAIPWNKTKPKTYDDYAGDTMRLDVERKTFVPSLLTPPMPNTVIDELRNRYSIFRTRHEPEYIEKKQREEEEKQERKKSVKKMRTPLNEANRKARKERKKLGKGKLTPEMLEKIGQVIASKRNLTLEAVGVSKETTEATESITA
ncbi:hypothetical protein ONS95_003800 [Cadophora gregata]|uniref:uncharacterized protein n=1 Tax=Cadophora gregata TaxID=51156 RepID=UPI0026DB140A|nr:uncharacterized protein ONS95_003800 [Cadophora gregata]KAK0107093.1 hypothetical protein ONS95_003800 [Cadophora gregata]KAK0116778.1 hypothetical protein ONS96_012628 [Cadophora gregata f. sp. sojae]